MSADFTGRWMYWNAMATPGATDTEIADFNRHYNLTHVPEVVAGNEGFLAGLRFELLRSADSLPVGPRWLAIYLMADQSSADAYITRDRGPAANRPAYTPGPPVWQTGRRRVWRMIWRRIGSAGSATSPLRLVRMIGLDRLAGTTAGIDADSAAVSRLGLFELYHDFSEQADAPRYCLIIEPGVDEDTDRWLGSTVRWDYLYQCVPG